MLTQEAIIESHKIEGDAALDGRKNGGQVDAFRHAYWMALLSQKIKWKKVYKLGVAHEKGNYRDFKKGIYEENAQPDSMSTVMDLYNNKVGIFVGCENKGLKKPELKKMILEKIKSGELKILKCDEQGNFLTCNDQVIFPTEIKKWGIPKCLVNSNE